MYQTTDIIGYVGNAAMYCPPCAGEVFGFNIHQDDAGVGV